MFFLSKVIRVLISFFYALLTVNCFVSLYFCRIYYHGNREYINISVNFRQSEADRKIQEIMERVMSRSSGAGKFKDSVTVAKQNFKIQSNLC